MKLNKIMFFIMIVEVIALGVFVSCSTENEADALEKLEKGFYEENEEADFYEEKAVAEVKNSKKNTGTVVSFDNGKEKYIVDFTIRYNDTHTNGHVVIKTIQINNYTAEVWKTYEITPTEDNLYIEAVHTTVGASRDGEMVSLGSLDKNARNEFVWTFRTAEAMVLAYYDEGKIASHVGRDSVLAASERMEGRKHGLYFK